MRGKAALLSLLVAGLSTVVAGHAVAGATSSASDVAPAIVLGRFSTIYTKDEEHKARAINVELAAEAIDGHVIRPGATFSFNDAVGERTAAFGFAKSIVIRDRMMAEGMGGGTCQVASTLYAAALLAGLDVVSRAPHTRPSAYIRMGLDATVAFPTIDLKLRNPPAAVAPVVVHARGVRGQLEVWLDAALPDGAAKPDVSLTSEIIERLPFERVIKRDRTLTGDAVRLASFGIPGYKVQRTRAIRTADGAFRRDVRTDIYPPTSEILEVAPAFDSTRLTRGSGSASGESSASERDGDDERVRPSITIGPAAIRPLLVQLRPSTLVRLDNAGTLNAAAAADAAESVKASPGR